MAEKIASTKIIIKNTEVRRLKIKGLMPGTIVVNNLLLKDVTFYTIDCEPTTKIKMRIFTTPAE